MTNQYLHDNDGTDHFKDCRPFEKDVAIKATEPTDTEIKVWEAIQEELGKHFGPDKFSNSANIVEDLKMDRGERVNLLVGLGLEDDFCIGISDEEYEEFHQAETVQDLINLVEGEINGQ